jgi:hypothetical protein
MPGIPTTPSAIDAVNNEPDNHNAIPNGGAIILRLQSRPVESPTTSVHLPQTSRSHREAMLTPGSLPAKVLETSVIRTSAKTFAVDKEM